MSDFERSHELAPDAPLNTEAVVDPIDDTPEGLLERLKGLDYKDPRVIATIGAVAAATAAIGGAYWMLSRKHGGHQVHVGYADRRALKDGVISAVEIVKGGTAVSLPTTSEAYDTLTQARGAKALFAMDEGNFAYPQTGDPEHVSRHVAAARKVGSWLMERLENRVAESRKSNN